MFTSLNEGTVLQNRYKIVGLLGKGGMGAVYRARHLTLRTNVAIKQIILAGDDDYVTAFKREASLLANLSQESLPRVLDFFSENEGHFIVMELIDGEDLLERLRNHQRNGFRCLPLSEVLDATNQLLNVLDYLHGKQIVHKDLKPANLKITTSGKLKLLDFGLAKGHAGEMSKHLSSFLKGATPDYAPPEQLRNESTSPQSDLFSVGATMYHLLSGKVPLDPLSQRALKMADGEPDPLPLLNEINAEVSPEIAKILHKSMALNANKRFESAKVMQTELREAVTLIEPTKPSPTINPTLPPKIETPKIVSEMELPKFENLLQTNNKSKRVSNLYVGIIATALFASVIVGLLIFIYTKPNNLKQTLTGHTDDVRSVAFSPDGQTIASGSYDKTIKLWSVK